MIRMSINTEVRPADAEGIARAAELLRQGELVALPTETVYGIAADARNGEAVSKKMCIRDSLNPIQARYQNCATPGHHPLPPYRSTGDMKYYTRIRQSCQQIFAIFLDFFEESMILTVMRCFASY